MERSTRQRSAIRTVIDAAGRPLSPQEVLETAQAEVPALGLATVYRNLKTLVDQGEISVVTLPGDSPRYESAEHAHHHHFQCTNCKRVFDVHACPGDLAQGLQRRAPRADALWPLRPVPAGAQGPQPSASRGGKNASICAMKVAGSTGFEK